jgi:hypothetical protein
MARNNVAWNNLARNSLARNSLAGAGLAGHLVACLPMAWPARAGTRLARERLRTRLSPASRSGLASAARPLVSYGQCVQPRAAACAA